MEQATSSKYGGEPNPLESTGLCLLSLDGGGVRGLSTLYILKIIMDRLNDERKKTANLPPMKPCEVFDLIGGTSTGGLIAIMLGRLEMDVDECITAYSELAEAVFGEKLSSIPFNITGKVKPRFDSAKLQEAVRKVVRSSASDEDLLNDGTERGCRTFVCTAGRETKDIVRLRSYSVPDEPNIRATICQAALATSAATTFFGPVSIGDRTFADGGLGANNPVDEVEGEASNIWCSETGDLKPLVKCFISIGTGNPGKKAFEESMIKFLGQTIVDIATETENTEKKFIARWAKHFDEKRYYRFNVEQGLQNIGLDEYKKKGAMEAATEGYLTHTAQKFRVRDCIQNLRLKQNNTETSFAAVVNEYTLRTIRQQPGDHDSTKPSAAIDVLKRLGQSMNEIRRTEEAGLRRVWNAHSLPVNAIAFSPDMKTIASGSTDSTLKLWEVETGSLIREFKGHMGPVHAVAFSPDGKAVASGSADLTARLWHLKSGELIRELSGHTDSINALAFSSDGQLVVSGSSDLTVKVWLAGTGELLREHNGHNKPVRAVAFALDVSVVVSGAEDKTVVLWNVESGQHLREPIRCYERVNAVACSLVTGAVVFGSDDRMVRVCAAAATRAMAKIKAPLMELQGHYLPVTAVAFSPDGQTIASGSADRTVKLWHGRFGMLLREFKGHQGSVTSVAFSPDGRMVASTSSDKTVRLWDVEE